MTIDIAELRELLTASPTRPGTWRWDASEAAIRHLDENGDGRWAMIPQPLHDGATVNIDETDAELIIAAVNALPELLAIAEAAYAVRDSGVVVSGGEWDHVAVPAAPIAALITAVDAARKAGT